MSTIINLSIHLPMPNAGQKNADPRRDLQGEVEVQVDRACSCGVLTINAEWKADPIPNPPPTEPTSGSVPPITLFQDPWTRGTHRYPFTIARPALDLPLRWIVTLNAETTSQSIKENKDVTIRISSPDSRGNLPPSKTLDTSAIVDDLKNFSVSALIADFFSGHFVWIVLGSLGGMWLLFLVSIGIVFGWGSPEWLGLLITPLAVAAFVGLLWFFHYVQRRLIANALGSPILSINPAQTRSGGQVEATLALNPPKTVLLQGVKAYLLCLESYQVRVRRKGLGVITRTWDTKTRERELHCSPYAFDLPQHTLTAHQPLILRQSLEIPSDKLPPSGAKIRWCVRVTVSLPGCPDWSGEKTIKVMPPSTLENDEP